MELKDIAFFPFWWYTQGFVSTLLSLKGFVANSEKSLAFSVWFKNILTPMYGQRDWQGFLVSVMIRIVQVIFRGFSMLVVLFIALILAILWLIIPILIFHQILFQLGIVEFNLFV